MPIDWMSRYRIVLAVCRRGFGETCRILPISVSLARIRLGMGLKDRERIFENIVRLRRAERQTGNSDIAMVREDLEVGLGGSVSRSLAASLLGVSHTALNGWIAAGDVPVVITEGGRKEVPLPTLLDLYERVGEERSSGRRRLHVLEPVMVEGRRRAERMRPGVGLEEFGERSVPHRRQELRSLAYHRALAPRLRRFMVDEAQRKLARWKRDGRIDPRYAEAWDSVFAMPMADIQKVIGSDDPRGRDLRQNSPLAGMLSEPERRRILEAV
jgi:hypothetical protein